MNESWLLFYGRQLNMQRREIMITRYGEMLDMISCLAIYNGAEPADNRIASSIDESLEVV